MGTAPTRVPPYWAAPQTTHHRPDGTLTQAGEASVKRRMSAPTMTRPDHITLPNGGDSVQDGQRIRVKHGRTGRISVVEVVAAAGGGPDVTAIVCSILLNRLVAGQAPSKSPRERWLENRAEQKAERERAERDAEVARAHEAATASEATAGEAGDAWERELDAALHK